MRSSLALFEITLLPGVEALWKDGGVLDMVTTVRKLLILQTLEGKYPHLCVASLSWRDSISQTVAFKFSALWEVERNLCLRIVDVQ